MICPCCYRTLALEADLPPPRGIGRLGDLYCVNCRWLFAVEMLGGDSPMWLTLPLPRSCYGRWNDGMTSSVSMSASVFGGQGSQPNPSLA